MTRVAMPLLIVAALLTGALPAQAALFGLVDTGELYKSTDGGAAWTILATLPVSDAVGLAAGSSTSQLFVATRAGTVYKSTNAGTSWSAVGALTASDVAAFTINYDATVLALTESGTLYSSTDGGATFTALAALTASNFVSLSRGPLGRLYALTRTGEVYESQSQGAVWTAVGRVTVSNAVSLRRRVAELHILTDTGETYRSFDYGRTWVPVSAITASGMSAILDMGSTLVAAARTGEVYSSANGTTWVPVGAINQLHLMALGGDTPLATGVPIDETMPWFTARAPYPNPTSRAAGSRFAFVTAQPERVRLELFDVRGRRVAALEPQAFDTAGLHAVDWRPAGVAAGTYYVRVSGDSGYATVVRWSFIE